MGDFLMNVCNVEIIFVDTISESETDTVEKWLHKKEPAKNSDKALNCSQLFIWLNDLDIS